MGGDSLFGEGRTPFKHRDENEPKDAAVKQQTRHIDLSLLNDAERAYYMRTGKLPPASQSEDPKIAAMSRQADEMLSEFAPKSVTPPPLETISAANAVSDTQFMTEQPIVPDVTPEETAVTDWDRVDSSLPRPTVETPTESLVSPTDAEHVEVEDHSPDAISDIDSIAQSFTEDLVADGGVQSKELTDAEVSDIRQALSDIKTMKETQEKARYNPDPVTTEDLKKSVDEISALQTGMADFAFQQATKGVQVTPTAEDITTALKDTAAVDTTQKTDTSISTPTMKKDTPEDTYTADLEDTPDTEVTTNNPVQDYGLILADEDYKTVYKTFRDEITQLVNKYNLDNSEEYEKYTSEMTDPNKKYFKHQLLNGVTTASRDFDQNSVNEHELGKLAESMPNECKPKTSSSKVDTSALKSEDKVVRGKQAKMLVLAKLRGTKRVFLANSGFYIDVRPLTNLELSEYINTIHIDNAEYGRTLGGHFYLYANMFVKKFFAERLTKIVVGSNLQGWTQGTTLQDNISLQDFRTLLWACADLMFKDGVEFTKICAFCTHIEKVTMNLSKLYFVNHPAMTSALEYIKQKKTVTPEDCEEYRNRLMFDVPSVYKQDGWHFIRKVPSLTEYINYADMFYADLTKHVDDVKNTTEVQNFIRSTYFKQYAPWIKEIAEYSDDSSEPEFKLAYADDIIENIADIAGDSKEFIDAMEEYIHKTMLTYIAFPYIACPKCGKVPDNIKNGFVAYDIESAFFMMSVRKSQEISSRLRDSTAI